jgi:hypothetical protein
MVLYVSGLFSYTSINGKFSIHGRETESPESGVRLFHMCLIALVMNDAVS